MSEAKSISEIVERFLAPCQCHIIEAETLDLPATQPPHGVSVQAAAIASASVKRGRFGAIRNVSIEGEETSIRPYGGSCSSHLPTLRGIALLISS